VGGRPGSVHPARAPALARWRYRTGRGLGDFSPGPQVGVRSERPTRCIRRRCPTCRSWRLRMCVVKILRTV